MAKVFRAQPHHVLSAEDHISADHLSGGREQLSHPKEQRGLPASGLADDPHELSGFNGKADPIHSAHVGCLGQIRDRQVPDFNQRLGHAASS